MRRFFAFGCSFTFSNSRPTWADIIGKDFEHYENWGRPGSGNQYIFNSLIECNQRNKFTPQDTVYIMWTSFTREDRYVKDQWTGNGNIYMPNQIYSQDWIREFACERGYLIRDLATISATRDILNHWGVNYKFLSVLPISNPSELHESQTIKTANQDVLDLYQDISNEFLTSIWEIVYNSKNWSQKESTFGAWVEPGLRDPHPDPIEALEYVQKVLPEVNISLETVNWVRSFKLGDQLITNNIERL